MLIIMVHYCYSPAGKPLRRNRVMSIVYILLVKGITIIKMHY